MTEYLEDRYNVNDPGFVSVLDELSLWSAMFGLVLLKHVELRPNIEVLDVGCGTGFPLLELAQRLGPSCRVTGIDPWSAALERARRKILVLGISNVNVIEGDAAAMPFEAGAFDVVVSNLGVNNFDEPEAVLAECWRVAKPGATIALTTNLQGHMGQLYDVFRATLEELGMAAALDRLRTHVEHRTTVRRLSEMLVRVVFTVRRVCEESLSMRFLDGSALLRHAFIKVAFLGRWRSVVAGEDEQRVFRRLEESLNRHAQRQGGLELTIPMAYVEGEKCA